MGAPSKWLRGLWLNRKIGGAGRHEREFGEAVSERVNVSSGSPYEPIVGFSRAVRVGNHRGGRRHHGGQRRQPGRVGDPAAQTRAIIETIEKALAAAGASLKDVIRTRVYLVDIAHWEAVGRVHGEVFSDIRPANSIAQVSRFIDPDWLVEIEVDAVIGSDGG